MQTETDQPIDIPRLVKNDMAKFLASDRGRPAYDDAVFRRPESLPAATRLIKDYLGSERPDIISLEKMVDYAGDVYDQAIGFAVMAIEYSPEGLEGDEELYRDVRQGIISFLKTYKPNVWETKNQDAFVRLFSTIRPRRLKPSDFRRTIWSILYGEDVGSGGLPEKMPHHRKEAYIRQQLEKM